jgi:hypothetical protein
MRWLLWLAPERSRREQAASALSYKTTMKHCHRAVGLRDLLARYKLEAVQINVLLELGPVRTLDVIIPT